MDKVVCKVHYENAAEFVCFAAECQRYICNKCVESKQHDEHHYLFKEIIQQSLKHQFQLIDNEESNQKQQQLVEDFTNLKKKLDEIVNIVCLQDKNENKKTDLLQNLRSLVQPGKLKDNELQSQIFTALQQKQLVWAKSKQYPLLLGYILSQREKVKQLASTNQEVMKFNSTLAQLLQKGMELQMIEQTKLEQLERFESYEELEKLNHPKIDDQNIVSTNEGTIVLKQLDKPDLTNNGQNGVSDEQASAHCTVKEEQDNKKETVQVDGKNTAKYDLNQQHKGSNGVLNNTSSNDIYNHSQLHTNGVQSNTHSNENAEIIVDKIVPSSAEEKEENINKTSEQVDTKNFQQNHAKDQSVPNQQDGEETSQACEAPAEEETPKQQQTVHDRKSSDVPKSILKKGDKQTYPYNPQDKVPDSLQKDTTIQVNSCQIIFINNNNNQQIEDTCWYPKKDCIYYNHEDGNLCKFKYHVRYPDEICYHYLKCHYDGCKFLHMNIQKAKAIKDKMSSQNGYQRESNASRYQRSKYQYREDRLGNHSQSDDDASDQENGQQYRRNSTTYRYQQNYQHQHENGYSGSQAKAHTVRESSPESVRHSQKYSSYHQTRKQPFQAQNGNQQPFVKRRDGDEGYQEPENRQTSLRRRERPGNDTEFSEHNFKVAAAYRPTERRGWRNEASENEAKAEPPQKTIYRRTVEDSTVQRQGLSKAHNQNEVEAPSPETPNQQVKVKASNGYANAEAQRKSRLESEKSEWEYDIDEEEDDYSSRR